MKINKDITKKAGIGVSIALLGVGAVYLAKKLIAASYPYNPPDSGTEEDLTEWYLNNYADWVNNPIDPNFDWFLKVSDFPTGIQGDVVDSYGHLDLDRNVIPIIINVTNVNDPQVIRVVTSVFNQNFSLGDNIDNMWSNGNLDPTGPYEEETPVAASYCEIVDGKGASPIVMYVPIRYKLTAFRTFATIKMENGDIAGGPALQTNTLPVRSRPIPNDLDGFYQMIGTKFNYNFAAGKFTW